MFSIRWRLALGAALLISTLLVLIAPTASFAQPKPAAGGPQGGGWVGPPLGVIPDRGSSVPATKHVAWPGYGPDVFSATLACPMPAPDPSCNMTYHGGALIFTHTTRVVYWEPAGHTSVSANYHSLINRYLTDVAADSGRATNVYAVNTQYYDSVPTNINYDQTFGGAFTDTTAYPANLAGCPTTDGTITVGVCLTSTQQATELDNYIQANSLPRGLGNLYFLVMPQDVETCYDDFSDCGNLLDISPRYCAYHSSFNIAGHGLTIWANEPYIGIAQGHCATGTHSRPNGDDADHELNPLSHEHNEIITDPTGGGWFDVDGSGENGDKCNFNFGTAIASTANGAYNQLINHNPYEIQLEWSNAITGCAANYGATAPTALFTYSPPTPKAGDPVSFDGTGSHSNNTGGYIIQYDWTFGDGGTATGATPAHTYASSGTYTVNLTVKDDAGLTGSVSHDVTVVKRPTTTTYTGDTTGDFNDSVTLSANLKDTGTSAGLSGKGITFTLGTQSCSGTTNGSGNASCSITLTQVPGLYTMVASFAGDSTYESSSASAAFTITKEETTTTYIGPTVILAGGSSITLKGLLLEDGNAATPIAGRTLTLSLGAQSCNGTTNTAGVASCTLVYSGGLGSQPLKASFAGDAFYLPSSDSSHTAIVFAFPSRGAFVLGNNTVAAAGPATTLTWWGASWAGLNSLSGGPAPSAFKGFAATVSLPTSTPPAACGSAWTTESGNSSDPPGTVPSYMGVLVASSVQKSGSTISGNTTQIVVVKVNPGYAGNPGHAGTGTIVATYCP